MIPGKVVLWLPLTRLTAFFVAVVVAGTYFLRSIHTPAPAPKVSPDREAFEKRRRRTEKEWRILRDFVHPTAAPAQRAAPVPKAPMPPPAARPPDLPRFFDVRCPVCGNAEEQRLPRSISETFSLLEFHRHSFGADLPAIFLPLPRRDWLGRTVNDLMRLPDLLIDGALDSVRWAMPKQPADFDGLERMGIVDRFVDEVGHSRSAPDVLGRFFGELEEGEVDYFSGFRGELLTPEEFEDPDFLRDVDILDEQRKILLKALQDTYAARFRGIGRRAKEAAYRPLAWNGVDVVVAPLVIAGTLFFSGFDRKFSMGPIQGRFEIEAFRTILERWKDEGSDDLRACAGLEIGWKDFPLRLLVTAGLYRGDPELEFVGVGTSLGEVRGLLDRASAGR